MHCRHSQQAVNDGIGRAHILQLLYFGPVRHKMSTVRGNPAPRAHAPGRPAANPAIAKAVSKYAEAPQLPSRSASYARIVSKKDNALTCAS